MPFNPIANSIQIHTAITCELRLKSRQDDIIDLAGHGRDFPATKSLIAFVEGAALIVGGAAISP